MGSRPVTRTQQPRSSRVRHRESAVYDRGERTGLDKLCQFGEVFVTLSGPCPASGGAQSSTIVTLWSRLRTILSA